jgi:hypothetical protein
MKQIRSGSSARTRFVGVPFRRAPGLNACVHLLAAFKLAVRFHHDIHIQLDGRSPRLATYARFGGSDLESDHAGIDLGLFEDRHDLDFVEGGSSSE